MKAIYKIDEHLPETTQIVVRFARLNAPESINNYEPVAIDYSKLDYHDAESFNQSLMRYAGNSQVKKHDQKESSKNIAEKISGDFDISSLVGRVIECKVDISRRTILRMNRVNL